MAMQDVRPSEQGRHHSGSQKSAASEAEKLLGATAMGDGELITDSV
jgi:hypothetical protein